MSNPELIESIAKLTQDELVGFITYLSREDYRLVFEGEPEPAKSGIQGAANES